MKRLGPCLIFDSQAREGMTVYQDQAEERRASVSAEGAAQRLAQVQAASDLAGTHAIGLEA